jgi:acyl-CoA reductase-like NAD-dependent aldehyde dehydrogenase
MRIAREETFGPVMVMMRFETEEQAVRLANDSVYALAGSVFSTDYRKAHRVADRITSGMMCVNDWAIVPLVHSLPFGGSKASGFGRFNGPEGLRAFCRQRSLVTDRYGIRAGMHPRLSPCRLF